jgi:antitoxin component YwqK of YwqJK toxin-antitoxin module
MAQKARLLFKLFVVLVSIISCKEKDPASFSLHIDTSMIPKDTIVMKLNVGEVQNLADVSNPNLKLDNGIYFLNKKAFSGYLKEVFNHQIMSIGSYLNGKQEGTTSTFYPNGKLKDIRSYKNGQAFGKHIGFWANGHQKFDFMYINDKREGEQKQWYESGTPYSFLSFKNDREEGMQKAWRENGKPYINYEVKDGFRYGLQKSALCYTLRNGKIK